MGYQMEYDFQKKVLKKPVRKVNSAFIVAVIMILLLFAVNVSGAGVQMLLFGQTQTAKIAAEAMVDSILQGEPLENAVEAFCLELIQ